MQHEIQIKKSDNVVDLFRRYLSTKEKEGYRRQEVIYETYFKLQLKLPSITVKTLANQALGITRLSYDVGIPLSEFLAEWDNQNKKQKTNKSK